MIKMVLKIALNVYLEENTMNTYAPNTSNYPNSPVVNVMKENTGPRSARHPKAGVHLQIENHQSL